MYKQKKSISSTLFSKILSWFVKPIQGEKPVGEEESIPLSTFQDIDTVVPMAASLAEEPTSFIEIFIRYHPKGPPGHRLAVSHIESHDEMDELSRQSKERFSDNLVTDAELRTQITWRVMDDRIQEIANIEFKEEAHKGLLSDIKSHADGSLSATVQDIGALSNFQAAYAILYRLKGQDTTYRNGAWTSRPKYKKRA